MNAKQIITRLKEEYPGKRIYVNDKENPSEIVCEIEPTDEHQDYSVTVAVVSEYVGHSHPDSEEDYEVLFGKLTVMNEGVIYKLGKGEKMKIKAGEHHKAEGDEVWIKVTSRPGWKPDGFYLVENT